MQNICCYFIIDSINPNQRLLENIFVNNPSIKTILTSIESNYTGEIMTCLHYCRVNTRFACRIYISTSISTRPRSSIYQHFNQPFQSALYCNNYSHNMAAWYNSRCTLLNTSWDTDICEKIECKEIITGHECVYFASQSPLIIFDRFQLRPLSTGYRGQHI